MALTRDRKETIRARVQSDLGFREALLCEGIENFLSGDVGFPKLSEITHRSAKSLMRMFGPHGNPQARNLFEMFKYLQKPRACSFEIRPRRIASRTKRTELPGTPRMARRSNV